MNNKINNREEFIENIKEWVMLDSQMKIINETLSSGVSVSFEHEKNLPHWELQKNMGKQVLHQEK